MSKELIVSTGKHETRVAILEDDQLVEIFHEREKEYSLAGSIHKGRVTRVLPGMQSAFVDIGLERDAFLYVSDFFEDNEEYDKIVTSVEDKVLKLERVATVPPPAPAPTAIATEPEPAADAEPRANPAPPTPIEPPAEASASEEQQPPVASEATVGAPAAGPSGPNSGDSRREDQDRRGRRGRRRRGGKGRGLPESKFYSPTDRGPAELPEPPKETHPEPPVATPASEADDFFVLAGESLAKYSRPEEDGAEDLEPESLPEVSADLP